MWLYPAASPNLQDVITISITNKGLGHEPSIHLEGFTHTMF